MNIRIDKDLRIRLDQVDVDAWKSARHLIQRYRFGMLCFSLELKEDSNSPCSHVLVKKYGLAIVFNSKDSQLICNNMLPESGISFSDINIQIDKWDIEKRNRFEIRKKEQKA